MNGNIMINDLVYFANGEGQPPELFQVVGIDEREFNADHDWNRFLDLERAPSGGGGIYDVEERKVTLHLTSVQLDKIHGRRKSLSDLEDPREKFFR